MTERSDKAISIAQELTEVGSIRRLPLIGELQILYREFVENDWKDLFQSWEVLSNDGKRKLFTGGIPAKILIKYVSRTSSLPDKKKRGRKPDITLAKA